MRYFKELIEVVFFAFLTACVCFTFTYTPIFYFQSEDIKRCEKEGYKCVMSAVPAEKQE